MELEMQIAMMHQMLAAIPPGSLGPERKILIADHCQHFAQVETM